MFGLGVWEVLLIVGLVILFFGGRKLPELAKGLGASIRNFKGELQKPDEPGSVDSGDDHPSLKG